MSTLWTYDTEFLERGTEQPVSLISIGIVNIDDDREYYAVNANMPVAEVKQNPWLMKHVWPYLPRTEGDELDFEHEDVKPHAQIAEDVKKLLLSYGEAPELWAWYSSYDHLMMAQLFGRMIDLPNGIPMATFDLLQESHLHRIGLPHQSSGLHNALADARHNRERYLALREARVVR
jgi:hypothetical protein